MQKINSKISYSNGFVYVEKYEQIISISNNKIVLKNYQIIGYKLKIDKLDGYLIVVSGNIKQIKMEDYNNDTLQD